ncbi:MAG: anti-sigma factor antagonist [Candidatus Auribacter fodinae]|jgi:anti-sigma B factor antagonist|uniref:Anti-sigma factor antagonist n=1 Tax=Candidatus Auribacter fodinae TaxID=2093366 RepID=A0A3A4QVN6_9BACT|nr:MAG: anti-sigma factor antagonist [Candidatus Auribacter fodinae]
MEITTKSNLEVSVVHLKGELDNESSEYLRKNIEKLIESEKVNIVLDFKELSYSNSAGLRELIALYKLANASGGNLKLCALQPQLEDLFSFTNLRKVFDIYQNEDEAVASFTV